MLGIEGEAGWFFEQAYVYASKVVATITPGDPSLFSPSTLVHPVTLTRPTGFVLILFDESPWRRERKIVNTLPRGISRHYLPIFRRFGDPLYVVRIVVDRDVSRASCRRIDAFVASSRYYDHRIFRFSTSYLRNAVATVSARRFFAEIITPITWRDVFVMPAKEAPKPQDLEIMKLACQFVNCLTYPRKIWYKLWLIVIAPYWFYTRARPEVAREEFIGYSSINYARPRVPSRFPRLCARSTCNKVYKYFPVKPPQLPLISS